MSEYYIMWGAAAGGLCFERARQKSNDGECDWQNDTVSGWPSVQRVKKKKHSMAQSRIRKIRDRCPVISIRLRRKHRLSPRRVRIKYNAPRDVCI